MHKYSVSAALLAAVMIVLPPGSALAETAAPSARDVATVQDCLKSQRGRDLKGERCIGVVVDPCRRRARSTADQNACADRELRVWDDILNETYRRLGQHLDDDQKAKARDMQRAWIEVARQDLHLLLGLFPGHDGIPDELLLQRAGDRAPRHVPAVLHG